MSKNATLKSAIAVLVALIFAVPAFAQISAADSKAVEKSKQYYLKGQEYENAGNMAKAATSYDKAVTTISKVQLKYIYNNDLWELRCIYEYDRYHAQRYTDITKLIGKAGKTGTVTIDASKMKSSGFYTEMITSCYLATLFCGKQEMASLILHEKILEPSVDTTVTDEAKELYETGNGEYNQQTYTAAIRSYEKALKLDSTYYRATYKIGMSYFKDEKYEKAIPYFQKAIRLQPEMLSPYQYLASSQMKLKQWQEAYNTCVEGIIRYPDTRFFLKLEEIADKLGKTFNRHWMSRDYLPNIVTSTTQGPITDEPWSYYREAKDKLADYCNDEGVVKRSQSLTEMKHLESYSWEYMLKKTDTEDKEFGFARKMQAEGYLDCFVMVSMYHISFSEQYQDFAKSNGERIKKYIDTYLMK